jgi:NDP-sugar pyrophosphorylase family protein
MLAYTLDLLRGSGVEEVILYCTDFAPAVRKYLELEEDTW